MSTPTSEECSICGVKYLHGKQQCNCNAGRLQPLTSNESLISELRFAGNVKSIDPVTRDLLRRAREALEGQNAPETRAGASRLTAERDAARLVARKRLELLVEAGIVGGECEGCQMEHPAVNGYHEHGPSGIRIKCNAAESVGKDESEACAHCSHYHQNEFLPHKCCHCGSEKAGDQQP